MLFRSAVIACVAAAPAFAQPDPVARARLEKAAETLKGLTALTYRSSFTCEGLLVSQSAGADVTMVRDTDQPTKWRVKWIGSYKVGAEEASPIQLAFNPSNAQYTWQDDLRKEWGRRPEFQAPKPMIEGKNNAWVEDLSKPDPLADQIAAPDIMPEADEEVGGVMCDIVLVRPEKGTPKRWAIGKEDHLPRRMEMLLEGGGIKGRFVYELTNVTANPPLTPEDADIAYPEGYIKNEAPPPPPPPPPGNDPAATATPGARTGPEAPAAPVKVVGAAVGNIAPDFELTRADLDGKGEEKVRLSALRGRAVVLEFGGSWNARSRAGHPELKALAERFRDKPVTIATVSVREKDPAKPVEYMKQNAYPWALLLAGDEAAKLYRVRVYPTYFVITPDGDIAHVALDYEKGKTLTKVEQLLDLFSADAPATPAGEAPKPSSDGG